MTINLSLISSDYVRTQLNERGLVDSDGNLVRKAGKWLDGVPMEEWDIAIKINLAHLDKEADAQIDGLIEFCKMITDPE